MSQDNILAALKPFADAWDEYVRDGGPDGKASAEILFRPDSEFIAASNALRGELAEARKLCGEVALSIEANSHYTQDEDLRTVLHDASIRLRATAKGRER